MCGGAAYFPLDYSELIINFAFPEWLFVLLFVAIGTASVLVSAIFYVVVRLTTHLEKPPPMRFWGFFSLIVPPSVAGTVMGLIPPGLLLLAAFFLIKGWRIMPSYNFSYPDKGWVLDGYVLHWYDSGGLNPAVVDGGRAGRFGLAFVVIGVLSLLKAVHLFIPPRESKREREMAEKRTKVGETQTRETVRRAGRSGVVSARLMA